MIEGKYLTPGNGIWQEEHVVDVHQALTLRQSQDTKIIFIASLPNTNHDINRAYNRFANDNQCRQHMIQTFGFPSYLFSETWIKSNGFAGSRKVVDANGNTVGNISWFRVLVKKMTDPVSIAKAYRWYEMTFFIHHLTSGGVTTVCCDLPDDFSRTIQNELNRLPLTTGGDWGYLQSLLLRHVMYVMDGAIWEYSKAIRHIETNRPKSQNSLRVSFDFPRLHDLLRHAVHCTELLEVTSQTLHEWIHQAEGQKAVLTLNTSGASQCLPFHEELLDYVQLVRNLAKRSSSNEARLRNEINLAFNIVAQQDTKAVRIISFVTLVFLPATFVSTLFSMSFFNYQHNAAGWAVASDIWIYFVITIPLTALTITAWYWGPVWAEKASTKGYFNWRVP